MGNYDVYNTLCFDSMVGGAIWDMFVFIPSFIFLKDLFTLCTQCSICMDTFKPGRGHQMVVSHHAVARN